MARTLVGMHRKHSDSLALAQQLAQPTYGLVSRHVLRAHGIDRHRLRRLANQGSLLPHGIHAVRVTAAPWDDARSPIVASVMNSGAAAWADGTAALVLAGLSTQILDLVDVGVPENASSRAVEGARRHRFRVPPPLRHSPVLHAEPHHALARACAWARTDAEAAALVHASLEQRLIERTKLENTLQLLPTLPRRAFVRELIKDASLESSPLADVDLSRLCRQRGLPEPDLIDLSTASAHAPTLEARWDSARLTVRLEAHPYPLREESYEDVATDPTIASAGDRVLHGSIVLERRPPAEFFERLLGLLSERATA